MVFSLMPFTTVSKSSTMPLALATAMTSRIHCSVMNHPFGSDKKVPIFSRATAQTELMAMLLTALLIIQIQKKWKLLELNWKSINQGIIILRQEKIIGDMTGGKNI